MMRRRFGLWLRLGRWWYHPWFRRVPVIAGGKATFALTQTHGRFRNDDGGELIFPVGASWVANEDTNASLNVDTNYRVRLQADETGGADGSYDWELRYSHNGGTYTAVSDVSTVVRSSPSSNITDGEATTAQLTSPGGTFTAGVVDDGNGVGPDISLTAGNYTEVEWCIQIRSADVANGDTIDFRAYSAGAAFAAYTVTIRATVVEGDGPAATYPGADGCGVF